MTADKWLGEYEEMGPEASQPSPQEPHQAHRHFTSGDRVGAEATCTPQRYETSVGSSHLL